MVENLRQEGGVEGKFISNLNDKFPTGEYENWERCRSLFPHVRSALLHRPKSHDSLRNWAALLYRGAWYAQECGNPLDLREMASMSRKERTKLAALKMKKPLKALRW